MMRMTVGSALARFSVGVLVERRKAVSPWADFLWRPVTALPGKPDTEPWTVISADAERTCFYAGFAEVELHRSETSHYLDNLKSGAPKLWIALRPTGGDPPYDLFSVTADPAEGESFTQWSTDIVEAVPMPETFRHVLEAFVVEHHVERTFFRRQRDRARPNSLERKRRVEKPSEE
jgi:hypothetical protein